MRAFKFLLADRVAPFSGVAWPAAGWLQAAGPIETCRNGIHACRVGDLPYWLEDELWEVELDGRVIEARLKVVAERARLVRKVEEWNEEARRAFAERCLLRVAKHAADELRDGGLVPEAEALETAAGLEAVRVTAHLALKAANTSGSLNAARLAAYAEDAVAWTIDLPPSGVAYVAAHAADARSRSESADAFVAERSLQAEWIATALRLG